MGETIFAQATPTGRSGVAIIRISGPQAKQAIEAFGCAPVADRRASLRWLSDPRDGRRLDQALILQFSAPRSFTGEDVVELHLHGGPAVCRSVLAVLGRLAGFRPAEVGAFTRRALSNGRLDLAQVEGLGDLLAAETIEQQRQALALMEGALSRMAAQWRGQLVEALALIEASIDFADEDLPIGLFDAAAEVLRGVQTEIARELAGSAVSERLRDGFEIALVGAPNVGKSTLLNAIARRDAAIVSPLPGTTRDVLEVRLDLEGLPVTMLDMAGLRKTEDPIERLGVERARMRAEAADIRVFLIEPGETAVRLGVACRVDDPVVAAKADLLPECDGLAVSGLTGGGIDDLLAVLAATLRQRLAGAATLNRERQRRAVASAAEALALAARRMEVGDLSAELLAEDVRAAVRALDGLVGRVDVEAVLDVIFSSFCIGK